jgi:acetyltransferase
MDCDVPEAEVTLRDGRVVRVRAVRPADEGEILQAFARMSEQARYMRFMRAVQRPNVARLQQVLASLPAAGIGLVATVPADDGIDIVGSAIAIVGSDPRTCEFAIHVASAFERTGLATALLTRLIDAARQRRLQEIEGFVLADNAPMLGLARKLGFAVERDPDDPSVRHVRCGLAAP